MADRGEVIELMRRNLADLEQAFSEMGHENISFSFEQNDGFKDQSEYSGTESDSVDWSDEVITTPSITIQHNSDATVTSGIDIRI